MGLLITAMLVTTMIPVQAGFNGDVNPTADPTVFNIVSGVSISDTTDEARSLITVSIDTEKADPQIDDVIIQFGEWNQFTGTFIKSDIARIDLPQRDGAINVDFFASRVLSSVTAGRIYSVLFAMTADFDGDGIDETYLLEDEVRVNPAVPYFGGISTELIDDIEFEDQTGDDELNPGDTVTVIMDLEADVKYEDLRFTAQIRDTTENVKIGREVQTREFTMNAEDKIREFSEIKLNLPDELDGTHTYAVEIIATADTSNGPNGANIHGSQIWNSINEGWDFEIVLPEDSFAIKDVSVSKTTVEAGSSFTVRARIYNNGENKQENTIIKAEIPELGISMSENLGTIFADEDTIWSATFGVPRDAAKGTYDLKLSILSDDVKSPITYTGSVVVGEKEVSASSEVSARLIANEDSKEIGKTGGAFSLTLVNSGKTEATYVISVSGTSSWAKSTMVTPRNVVTLKAGETKDDVQVFVAPKDGVSGDKTFSVKVESLDGKELDSKELTATVTAEKSSLIGGFGPAKISEQTIIKGLQWVFAILIIVAIVLFVVWLGKKGAKPEGGKDDKVYY